jgi:hypothetical protein
MGAAEQLWHPTGCIPLSIALRMLLHPTGTATPALHVLHPRCTLAICLASNHCFTTHPPAQTGGSA